MWTGERYGSTCLKGRVYSSATTNMVAEIVTKLVYPEPSKQTNFLNCLNLFIPKCYKMIVLLYIIMVFGKNKMYKDLLLCTIWSVCTYFFILCG
jgi:hypothetical protein